MNLINKKKTLSLLQCIIEMNTQSTLMAITSKQNLIIMNKRTSTSKRIN